ncbi:MAG: hypothetical protein AB7O57_12240, partial [Hyphomicrobiaceae bacterium]
MGTAARDMTWPTASATSVNVDTALAPRPIRLARTNVINYMNQKVEQARSAPILQGVSASSEQDADGAGVGVMPDGSAVPSLERSSMLAERRNVLVHALGKAAGGLMLAMALALGTPAGPASARDALKFVSPEAALEHGLGAYRSGFYKLAEQALTYAAERGNLLGRYNLARLYADPSAPFTDHPKAYELYRGIVEEHAARI